MSKKRHTAEQIINKLRQAEVELSRGVKIAQVCRKLGVTEQTYYRWRKEYGGVRTDQAKRLKELEKENSRLKKGSPRVSVGNPRLPGGAVSEGNASHSVIFRASPDWGTSS